MRSKEIIELNKNRIMNSYKDRLEKMFNDNKLEQETLDKIIRHEL